MKKLILLMWLAVKCWSGPAIEQVTVYSSGTDGYHTYRIPAVVMTKTGTLLAFAEGRKLSASDTGDVDLLLKRSADGGRTWSAALTVWDDGRNTCGNPCPVVDNSTGTVWLLLTWNRGEDSEAEIIAQTSRDTRRVFVTRSIDGGRSWEKPGEITASVKRPDWTWHATGPGAGIQLVHGPKRGRLIIPCDHIEAGTKRYFSHVIYSDDGGQNWALGGASPRDQVNECEVVELTGNRLMLNMRNYDRSHSTRQMAISLDQGLTWIDQRHAPELIEPVCQASMRRASWPGEKTKSVLLFSNPASTKREQMTVRLSGNEGQTWTPGLVLHAGPAAYSCLVRVSDEEAGCLYERGQKRPYETITFARFTLEEVKAAGRSPMLIP